MCAAELTATWVTPTQREDDTTLAAADIAAFIGTKTLVMRTMDKNGIESNDSNAVTVTFSQLRALQFRVYMTVP